MGKNIDDPRRAFLVDALSLGLFASVSVAGIIQVSHALGDVPRELPEGRSIFRLEGRVMIDAKIADINTKIGPNSLVITGPGSQIFPEFVQAQTVIFNNGNILI